MKRRNLIEGRFVKSAAHQPALAAITVEIALAQVFDPDEPLCRIVEINLRHSNPVLVEKFGNLDVMLILFALQIVFDQNHRLVHGATNSIKFPVRSSSFDGPDFYLIDIQTREMHPRSPEKKVGSHNFRCRCCDGRRWPVFGNGQYKPVGDFWKQFVHRPTKSCLPESLPTQRDNPVRRLCSRVIARLDRQSRSCGSTISNRSFLHGVASIGRGKACGAPRDSQRANRC